MELPEGWRVGRRTLGYYSVFYKDQQVARLFQSDFSEEAVRQIIASPPAKIYPELFRAGMLDTIKELDEQGVRYLVKDQLLSPDDAYEICPSIKAWLRRNKLWSKDEETSVIYNGMKYVRRGNDWYSGEQKLQKPAHFQSVWAARVAFAKGECTLKDIAEYSWGAVLEVIGDQERLLPDTSRATLDRFRASVYFSIMKILNSPKEVGGFRKSESGLWCVVPRIFDLRSNPNKWRKFWSLLWRVINEDISGYCARLSFTNAHYQRIMIEKQRWDLRGYCLYAPPLVKFKEKVQAKQTLAEARDYVQRSFLEMQALGIFPNTLDTAFFQYDRNTYGVRLNSGKLFFVTNEATRYIPKDFDKWSEERQKNYLDEDYDAMVEDWCKRSKANRRLYYYLKHCAKISAHRAWEIASSKHRRLSEGYMRRRKAAGRWACYHANKTASAASTTEPRLRLEAI